MQKNTRRPHRRRSGRLAVLAAGVVGLGLLTGAAPAMADDEARLDMRHAGSLFVTDNLRADDPADTPTSAEIVAVTPDGKTAVYTDGLAGRLGFADVSRASSPRALGAIDLPGDPTSVAVHRGWALVTVSTSDDYTRPAGDLLVIDLATREIRHTIPLAGQPDAVAVAPSGRYAAITIENERDEDLDDGLIPQAPPGVLQIVDLGGGPEGWGVRTVPLTGLAAVAPDDPEPEYVDVDRRDRAVVSLQENNHLVVVDLRMGTVLRHFSAGTADVTDVDTVEEELGPQGQGVISLTGALEDRRREPDGVAWIDDDTFATANEGDYEDAAGVEGGSRSFTLFNAETGAVEYEAGNRFEHEVVRAGHYPESRSENKGVEPEGLEVATHRGRTLLFVGAERANVVGVYDVTGRTPRFRQILPTGIGPEGIAFTSRDTLVVTSEVDGADEGFLARPVITLFTPGAPAYPQLRSADGPDGLPIPWVAMSGLAGDLDDPDTMWAVSDSYLAQPYVYRVDVRRSPAVITRRVPVGGFDVASPGGYDLEGVAAREDGGFWLASEGRVNVGSSRPNLLVRIDGSGQVQEQVPLPAALAGQATSSGFEGVAVTGSGAGETVYVAVQREWRDDARGLVKIGRYRPATGEWTFARYPLDQVTLPAGGFVGLSEITPLPDGRLAIVERDNQLGQQAQLKRVYAIDPASVSWAPYGGSLPAFGKTLLRDILPDLDRASISVPDKIEGLGVTADGHVAIVTDNDGNDENYGETVFVDLGPVARAFR